MGMLGGRLNHHGNMIGIVLVTHGGIGHEMRLAAEQILGPLPAVEDLEVQSDNDLDQYTQTIGELIHKVDNGHGVLILTDLFGGTPSNLAVKYVEVDKVDVLAGLNLPMLIKLLRLRSQNLSLTDFAEQGRAAAQKYINLASQIIEEERSCPNQK